jgi:D-alanyl-D-alanine carboxypeptidase/D-alanyl-D-alanine-endopeptidase (penicillin-binding protein 4)
LVCALALALALGAAGAVVGLDSAGTRDAPGRSAAGRDAPPLEARDADRAASPPPASVEAPEPECVPDPTLAQPPGTPSPHLALALAGFLGHPSVAPHQVSVSIWIDGHGEVLSHTPDLALAPASNQKVLTAFGALSVLGADARLVTELRLTNQGDLVIVGGGDPTISAQGPHSVAALADQARVRGIGSVPGALIVDETRHDGARRASAWQDWQIPAYTGPMSAFMVDRNRWRSDAAFVADPALANADLLRGELAARGIQVQGPTVYASGPVAGTVVASLASEPVAVLVRDMLLRSDNQIADLLLKEIGRAGTGTGSMAGGALVTTEALQPLCVPFTGTTDDGSGLSRGNARSARVLRTVLQAARTQPWWPAFADALPLAGRTGTLATRLRGTAAEGNVRAKTGTIIGGSALSGYGTTTAGRAFVFSVVVNGVGAQASAGAIDSLIAAVAADTG